MGIKSIGKALAENASLLAKAIKDGNEAEIDRRLDVCGRLTMAMHVARHGLAAGEKGYQASLACLPRIGGLSDDF